MAVVTFAVGMAGEMAGKIGSAVVVVGNGMTLGVIGRTERAGEMAEEGVEVISWTLSYSVIKIHSSSYWCIMDIIKLHRFFNLNYIMYY